LTLFYLITISGCSYSTGQYTSSRETYVEQEQQQPEAREHASADEAGEPEISKYSSADSNPESSTNLEVQDNDSSPTQFIQVQEDRVQDNPEILEVASGKSK